jgi:DNA-binding transcriptional LysR family regulator
MTLDQLKVFVAVAERQHVTQAAQALNLVASAVSHAISALEDEFQVALFDRVGRRIELTAAGRLLLDEARGIQARAATARLKMAEVGELKRGTLHLHASQTIASYWLPPRLMTYRRRYPLIELQMAIGNTDVARALDNGATELGFIEGTIEHPAIVTYQVARDQLILVVSASHPWARNGTISLPPILLKPSGSYVKKARARARNSRSRSRPTACTCAISLSRSNCRPTKRCARPSRAARSRR